MRNEVAEKITMMLCSRGIVIQDIMQELTIILNDYEIQARETALAIRDEDKNKTYLQKFLIAKTVSGRTKRTLAAYQDVIWRILCKINKNVDEITTDDIRLYLAYRQMRDKITKTTADNERRYLRSFFGFLHEEELISKNPMSKLETIKADKKKKKAFTEIEIEKIRKACKNEFETAVVETLLSTGCRVNELVNIKLSDIADNQILIQGKGNKEREVFLNAKAVLSIESYLENRRFESEVLFIRTREGKGKTVETPLSTGCIERCLHKIGEKAGVKNVHPHRFRRTCATFALRRGMPVEQVSQMLGHERLNTTQIYLDLEIEDLKQAHKKYVV